MKHLFLPISLMEAAYENLNDKEYKEFVNSIKEYYINDVEPKFEGVQKIIFSVNKPIFEYFKSRYNEIENEKLGLVKVDELKKQP